MAAGFRGHEPHVVRNKGRKVQIISPQRTDLLGPSQRSPADLTAIGQSHQEFTPEVAYYVVHFFHHLMTEKEKQAQNHLIATMKATLGRSDSAAQEEARASRSLSRILSDDPDVLRLAANGYEAFRTETARRILQECGDKVFFNLCPWCAGLARTPTAKQCRFCGLDWHERV